jgi:hypothetical protein
MSTGTTTRRGWRMGMIAMALGLGLAADARADWPRARRSRTVVVTTTTVQPQVVGFARPRMLGTFYPDPPTLNIRGNFEAGGGYSPLGMFGDNSATEIGPLSAFRTTAAPVLVYERGYDGSFRPGIGTSFSNPNFPASSPVVYPTRANVRNAGRRMSTPPQWESGINWIDLN